jgi:hypothetical protein
MHDNFTPLRVAPDGSPRSPEAFFHACVRERTLLCRPNPLLLLLLSVSLSSPLAQAEFRNIACRRSDRSAVAAAENKVGTPIPL